MAVDSRTSCFTQIPIPVPVRDSSGTHARRSLGVFAIGQARPTSEHSSCTPSKLRTDSLKGEVLVHVDAAVGAWAAQIVLNLEGILRISSVPLPVSQTDLQRRVWSEPISTSASSSR